jgi:hypothetical protein
MYYFTCTDTLWTLYSVLLVILTLYKIMIINNVWPDNSLNLISLFHIYLDHFLSTELFLSFIVVLAGGTLWDLQTSYNVSNISYLNSPPPILKSMCQFLQKIQLEFFIFIIPSCINLRKTLIFLKNVESSYLWI